MIFLCIIQASKKWRLSMTRMIIRSYYSLSSKLFHHFIKVSVIKFIILLHSGFRTNCFKMSDSILNILQQILYCKVKIIFCKNIWETVCLYLYKTENDKNNILHCSLSYSDLSRILKPKLNFHLQLFPLSYSFSFKPTLVNLYC